MVLVCSACGAELELSEEQLARLEIGLEDRTRCLQCDALAARVLRSIALGSSMSSVPPLQDLGEATDEGLAGRPLRLRRGGQDFRVRDLDRLRRLVMERKAAPSDLVSADGVRWSPVDSIPALQPFLAVVRFLDSSPTTGGGGVLVDASTASDGWGDGGPSHDTDSDVAVDEPDRIEGIDPIPRSRELP